MVARRAGFTLIELLVVMAIVATLLTIAVPRYLGSLDRARDTALRQTLTVTRDAIDKFLGDVGRYPESLDELVQRRYLRNVPYDPVAGSASAWVIVPLPDDRNAATLYDLRSSATGRATDGSAYADW